VAWRELIVREQRRTVRPARAFLLRAVRRPPPMPGSSARLALSTLILSGFAVGCATGGRSSHPAPASGPMVTADDMERNPDQPIEKILEAKVPGLLVSRNPDGTIALQIRGASSFYGGGAPLCGVDVV